MIIDEFFEDGLLKRRRIDHGLSSNTAAPGPIDGRQKAREWINAIKESLGQPANADCGVCARPLMVGDYVTHQQPTPHGQPFSHVRCYMWWTEKTSVEEAEDLAETPKMSDYALDHEFIRGAREARDRQRDEMGTDPSIFNCARCHTSLGESLDLVRDDPEMDGVSHWSCLPDLPPQLAFPQPLCPGGVE